MRDRRWLWSTVLVGLMAMAQGCSLRLDAPCVGDDDCRAEGETCLDGRCGAERCLGGDERICVVAEAGDCLGRQRCVDGRFERCRGPDELCDGEDNDCDGAADEDFAALGDLCARGEGLCAAQGAVVCEADGLGASCDAAPRPSRPETCDGTDDDCDGAIDEDFAGVGDPCARGEGVCLAQGTVICDAGGRSAVCDAAPGPGGVEACDGQDNDCDGATDEDIDGGPCDTGQPGLCGVGVARCLDGAPRCDAPGEGVPDLCDGIDDDCDGRVDEAAPEADTIGEPCAAGAGVCAAVGAWTCGPEGLTCDAAPALPQLELCGNRLDDDCDGEVDDRLSCLAGCGNGRRDLGEGCDDGNALDGDGCSAACAVEDGFVCRDGPPDTALAVDGRDACVGWRPVEAPPWIGGYGVAYAGGAVAVSADPMRYAGAYSLRAIDGERTVELHVGRAPDGRLFESEAREEAEEAAAGAFDVLAPGRYAVTFPDATCADNTGAVGLELRTLDDCRATCEDDLACRRFGMTCVEGVCTPPDPFCGDGRLRGDEQCDDGNATDGDGCSGACLREPDAVCLPAARFTVTDGLPEIDLPRPVWQIDEELPAVIQRANATPGHIGTALSISPDYAVRFDIQVASGFDDDFMGWTVGGGDTPLSDPAQPYLLFSWKQWAQSEPGSGPAERGLRVAQVSGPLIGQTLWSFEGENFEALARGLTLGDASYFDRQAYVVEIIGDRERLLVFVDGVLEFDLAEPPIGDGRLGIYASSQEGVYARLIAPLEMQACD